MNAAKCRLNKLVDKYTPSGYVENAHFYNGVKFNRQNYHESACYSRIRGIQKRQDGLIREDRQYSSVGRMCNILPLFFAHKARQEINTTEALMSNAILVPPGAHSSVFDGFKGRWIIAKETIPVTYCTIQHFKSITGSPCLAELLSKAPAIEHHGITYHRAEWLAYLFICRAKHIKEDTDMSNIKIFEKVTEVTMTSLELVEFINNFRRNQAEAAGQNEFTELRHDNFIAKVPEVLGITASLKFKESYQPTPSGRKYPCYRFPKREACLMAMSYSYELQAAVYDRMTALEQQQYALPQSFSEALRALADSEEQKQALATERDEAIRTKAHIGSRREATSMATAAKAVRQVRKLEEALGYGRTYKQVKAIEWLPKVFDLSIPGAYSQIGKKLTALSEAMSLAPHNVPDEKYPAGVKAYHVDAIKAFQLSVNQNTEVLQKYRRNEN